MSGRKVMAISGMLLGLLLGSARADEGRIISSVKSPILNCDVQGVAYDGNELMVSCRGHNNAYRISADNGSFLRSIPLPEPAGSLTYNNRGNLIMGTGYNTAGDAIPPRIYELDPVTGSVQNSFNVNSPNPNISGLAFDSTAQTLIATVENEGVVRTLTQDGTELSTMVITASGLAHDGSCTYVVHREDDGIEKFNSDGSLRVQITPNLEGSPVTKYFEDAEFVGDRVGGVKTLAVANQTEYTPRILSRLTLNPGENYVKTSVIDLDRGFLYIGTDTDPGRIVEVDLSNFTRTRSLFAGARLSTSVRDELTGTLCFGTRTSPGMIISVDTIPLNFSIYTLNPGEDFIRSSVMDSVNRRVLVGTDTIRGQIISLDLANYTTRNLTLDLGEGPLMAAAINPEMGTSYWGYWGTLFNGNNPAVIVVDNVNLVKVSSISLSNSIGPGSAITDITRNKLYFGNVGDPIVDEVDSQTLNITNSIQLDSVQDLEAAVIDQGRHMAYFATTSRPPRIHVVDLSSFELKSSFDLPGDVYDVQTLTLDPNRERLYAVTSTEPSVVFELDVSRHGRGGRIDFVEVCPCSEVPRIIEDIHVVKGSNNIQLTWSTDANFDSYGIDRETNVTRTGLDRAFTPTRISTVTAAGYTDINAIGDGNELTFYSVRGKNCNGEGP